MDYSTLDDASLMRLLAVQRTEALVALYDRYARLVYSVAYHSVGDSGAAEEITQDVFLRVWEKAKTFDIDRAKLSTWMIAITRNRAIDELRRGKVRGLDQTSGWDDISQMDLPKTGSTEDLAAGSLEREIVRKAVASLPDDQRKVLSLAYFQGLSHSEIAQATGEPLGTVKTRLRLSMQKLRRALGQDEKESR